MGGRKEEVDGVGSGGGEKGGGVVDTYVQHLVVPEFQGGGGAEKIQVLRHFQHFPASACASMGAFHSFDGNV